MKPICSHIAAMAILTFAAGPLAAQDSIDSLAFHNCNWCHGTSAQGLAQAPRLAGQRAQYIESQLGGFASHIRDNPTSKKFMWNATANLSPDAAHALAGYFAAEPARPANDGNKDLVAAGQAIYEEGVGEANIAACFVCHGPKAEGVRQIPRLGGLSYGYLKARLEQWNEGFHATAKPMPQVARSLSASEIEALASYLSYVE